MKSEKKRPDSWAGKHITAIGNTCLVIIVILMVLVLYFHGQKTERMEIYNHSEEKLESEYARFDESIQTMMAGGDVDFEKLAGQYANIYLTLHQWNEVYPRYAEKGKLPFTSAEYKELEGTETMVDLHLELRDLYYSAVNLFLLDEAPAEGQPATAEELQAANQMFGEKIETVCVPVE